jgi:hypothetical protein
METPKFVFELVQFVGTLTAVGFGIWTIKQNARSTMASAASQLYTLADSVFTLRIENPTVVAQLSNNYEDSLLSDPKKHDQCLCLVCAAFNLYEQAFYDCMRYKIFAESDWKAWGDEHTISRIRRFAP